MFTGFARRRSLSVYHLHMGGPDGDVAAFRALRTPRLEARLRAIGVRFTQQAYQADIMMVTGLLLASNLDAVLREIASLPQPSTLVAVGDCAINGGQWAKLEMPGLAPFPLSHYADIQLTLPGDPSAPQEIIAGIMSTTEETAEFRF